MRGSWDYVGGEGGVKRYEGNDLGYGCLFEDMGRGYCDGLVWGLVMKYYGKMEFVCN